MTGYVVNASVAVKWLVDEPQSEQALKLLENDLPLLAPELIFAEVANALWAMGRRENIGADVIRDAIDLLADPPLTIP